MEPVDVIMQALVAGAAAGVGEAAVDSVIEVIKEAYNNLKNLIKKKYPRVDVDVIEANPKSEGRKKTLKEELEASEATKDEEIIKSSQTVIEIIQKQKPEIFAEINVSVVEINNALSFSVEDIRAEKGSSVNVVQTEYLDGDITFSIAYPGGGYNSDPKVKRE